MNGNFRLGLLIIVMSISGMFFTGCEDECDPSLNEEVGDEFFTLEYRTPGGQNYLTDIFNPSEVFVYLDTTGGRIPEPPIELIRPAFKDGKFGPFRFTQRFINPALDQVNGIAFDGVVHTFDYHIYKGEDFGEDVLRVEFLLEVDQCNRKWKMIRYFFNERLLDEFNEVQQAEIVIVQ